MVRSWLLELLVDARSRPTAGPRDIKGWVADSGEGRWTVQEAIDQRRAGAGHHARRSQARFRSRQDDSYGAKVLAALRNEFGGHAVKTE